MIYSMFLSIIIIGLIIICSKNSKAYICGILISFIALCVFNNYLESYLKLLLIAFILVLILALFKNLKKKNKNTDTNKKIEDNKKQINPTSNNTENIQIAKKYPSSNYANKTLDTYEKEKIAKEIKKEKELALEKEKYAKANKAFIIESINDTFFRNHYLECYLNLKKLNTDLYPNLQIEPLLINLIENTCIEYSEQKVKNSNETYSSDKTDKILKVLKDKTYIQEFFKKSNSPVEYEFYNNTNYNNYFTNLCNEFNYYDTTYISELTTIYTNYIKLPYSNKSIAFLDLMYFYCLYLTLKMNFSLSIDYKNIKEDKNYFLYYNDFKQLSKKEQEDIKNSNRRSNTEYEIIIKLDKETFQSKTDAEKVTYLVTEAQNIRKILSDYQDLFLDSSTDTSDLEEIIDIIIKSLKHYKLDLIKNTNNILSNINNILEIANEYIIKEKDKLEQKKKQEKKKKEQALQTNLNKKTTDTLKNKQQKKVKKEKKITEKQKKEQEKKEKEANIIKKFEQEKDKIDKFITNMFNNPSVFKIYTNNIISYDKNYADTFLYIIKRILIEIPENYTKENLKEFNYVKKTKLILQDIGYDEDNYYNRAVYANNHALTSLYNASIWMLENSLYAKEAINLKNNSELYQILTSLKSTTTNEEYILNKVYNMYKNFYKNTFNTNISKNEMQFIINIIDVETKYNKYKDDLLNTNKDMLKNGTIKVEKSNFTKIVKQIESTTFYKTFDLKDSKDFSYLLLSLFNAISLEEKYTLLENISILYNRIVTNKKRQLLKKEKDRILSGDMSKEIELQKLELDFSNIQNGYEFEEYVANLYRKLGYTIEEVTSKSGDQRCRCNSI